MSNHFAFSRTILRGVLFGVAGLTLLAVGGFSAAAQNTFPARILPSGKTPYAIVSADLNHDGIPDLVIANAGDFDVTILLGDGAGGYYSASDTTPYLPSPPLSVVIADVNGDGIPDIITCNSGNYPNYDDPTVSVLLGNGDGTFQDSVDYATGLYPVSLTAADLNHDGKIDLVTADYDSDSVSVLLNNGSGVFATHVDYPCAPNPEAVVIADLNYDGKPDVVIASLGTAPAYTNPTVSVLRGVGNGTLAAHVEYATDLYPGSLAVGDLDGDGFADVVTGNGANTVSVLRGKSDGTLSTHVEFATGSGPFGLVLADLNHDGRLDIATANYNGGSVSVLLNQSALTFSVHRDYPVGINPTSLVAVDTKGDGRRDLLVPFIGRDNRLHNYGGVALLTNNGGTFSSRVDIGPVNNAKGIASGDLNGDGRLDLVGIGNDPAITSNGQISVFSGNGDLTFSGPTTYTIPGGASGFVAIADVNGDGKPDVIVSNGSGSVLVYSGGANGALGTPQTYAAGNAATYGAVADVNGDGKPDLITGDSGSTISVLLNTGSGFAAPVSYPTGSSLRHLIAADVNGDGKPDIIVANSPDNTVLVRLNNGNGTFGAPHAFATQGGPFSTAVADVNEDGKPDILVGCYNTSAFTHYVSVLRGNGDGTFGFRLDFPTGQPPYSIAALDYNGDGHADIVTGDAYQSAVSVLIGSGDGLFDPHVEFATEIIPLPSPSGTSTGMVRRTSPPPINSAIV